MIISDLVMFSILFTFCHFSATSFFPSFSVTMVGDNVFAIGSLSPFVAHLPKIPEVFTNENVKAVEKLKEPD